MDDSTIRLNPSRFRSSLGAELALRHQWESRGGWRRMVWRRLRSFYDQGGRPVQFFLHGRPLLLRRADPYPFTLAQFPHFNQCLVAAATALRQHTKAPLRIIDIGAGVGDTAALLNDSVRDCFSDILCVDGSPDSVAYIESNTSGLPGTIIRAAMLSASEGTCPSLVRHHPGTAAAVGKDSVASQTLDTLIATLPPTDWNFLKIDVDGYDGEVLAGATQLLEQSQPLVVFEWHPALIQRCGNDSHKPFAALAAAGYRELLWFCNQGRFSHRSAVPNTDESAWWAEFLIAKNRPMDPHFDIIALPPKLEKLSGEIARQTSYP